MAQNGVATDSSGGTAVKDDEPPKQQEPPAAPKQEETKDVEKPELDEFGLPIRKKRPANGESTPQAEENGTASAEHPDAVEDDSKMPVKEPLQAERISIPIGDSEKVDQAAEAKGKAKELEASKEAQEASERSAKAEHGDANGQGTNGVAPPPYSPISPTQNVVLSEFSHQHITAKPAEETKPAAEDEWQEMPAYAPFDIYNDDGKLVAREAEESDDDAAVYSGLGGAGKGYTKVLLDEDAESATSMDDNTAYLFKEQGTNVVDEDEDSRDVLAQMQATKELLTDGEKIAYVGITRLAMIEMQKELAKRERTRQSKKISDLAAESMRMWAQKMVLRLYSHMDIESAEQLMIEQLSEHGVQASDLSPTLMKNAKVKNPMAEDSPSTRVSMSSLRPSTSDTNIDKDPMSPKSPKSPTTAQDPETSKNTEKRDSETSKTEKSELQRSSSEELRKDKSTEKLNTEEPSVENPKEESTEKPSTDKPDTEKPSTEDPGTEKSTLKKSDAEKSTPEESEPPPPYDVNAQLRPDGEVLHPSDLAKTENLEIDIRWTVLCDLFLVLVADAVYDARSRQLLERVGSFLDVPWIDICRFEKRVTDALEMQEAASKETWDEEDHLEARRKRQRNRRLAFMGLATVGGSLVIGLSAGLLAPLIGAGLAAGFTTIGVAGTSGFLTGAGGIAMVATTGVVTGGSVGVRAANRRTGSVKTFEYRPLHNNKRTSLIVTVSGWMTGNVDDVRLPFSTVNPLMGDIYSLHWEPEMLRSMGDTIGILASEALTQTLQQILGSTILISLMAALQLPIVLTKLSYLIDNPWSNSLARAHLAGLILADSLIDRNLGTRPITLVGFSLGSRVIFSCLQELAAKGAHGLIQNVYMLGSPVIAQKDNWLKARAVVAGRFVNGYAKNDWILGYLFRATGGGIMRVAGLAPVVVEGVENVDLSEFVPGHMSYRTAMPKLLRHMGWAVESDEFTEIEDPDPENHQRRQRELINEIEEARKELEEKNKKKSRFAFFGRKKKAERKEWETYDDRAKAGPDPEGGDAEGGVLFDVDAIRAQAARAAAEGELAAEGIEIRELETTMPPMRLDSSAATSRTGSPALKSSRSYNDAVDQSLHVNGDEPSLSRRSTNTGRPSYDNWDDYDKRHSQSVDGDGVSMTFDTAHKGPPSRTSLEPPSRGSPTPSARSSQNQNSRTSFEPPSLPAKDRPTPSPSPPPPPKDEANDVKQRPPTAASSSTNPEHNAWNDDEDDEFGKEKEMTMTFE